MRWGAAAWSDAERCDAERAVFPRRTVLPPVQDLPLTTRAEPFSDRRKKGMPQVVLLLPFIVNPFVNRLFGVPGALPSPRERRPCYRPNGERVLFFGSPPRVTPTGPSVGGR